MTGAVHVCTLNVLTQYHTVGEAAVQNSGESIEIDRAFQPQLARALPQPLGGHVVQKVIVILAAVVAGSVGGRGHRSNGHHRSYPPGSRLSLISWYAA